MILKNRSIEMLDKLVNMIFFIIVVLILTLIGRNILHAKAYNYMDEYVRRITAAEESQAQSLSKIADSLSRIERGIK